MSDRAPDLPRTLTFRDLLLFKLVAIVNVSLLTPSAGLGRSALWLWVVAFALFFIPEVVAVLALSKRYPEEGGLYTWANRQFGPTHGFISGWSYWTGNLFYFPMQLVYLAGVIAYAARGADSQSGRRQDVRGGGGLRLARSRDRRQRRGAGRRQVAAECRRRVHGLHGDAHRQRGRGGMAIRGVCAGAARPARGRRDLLGPQRHVLRVHGRGAGLDDGERDQEPPARPAARRDGGRRAHADHLRVGHLGAAAAAAAGRHRRHRGHHPGRGPGRAAPGPRAGSRRRSPS